LVAESAGFHATAGPFCSPPAGHLYQAIDIPVAVSGKGEEKARSLKGYPFPVPVAGRKAAEEEEGKGD